MQEALTLVAGSLGSRLMGKADFKAAFKTLGVIASQRWLCWGLVFNLEANRLQAVPLFSQLFGSLGGVAAWFRTAKAIQNIMLKIFKLPIYFYVDDAFWAATSVILP